MYSGPFPRVIDHSSSPFLWAPQVWIQNKTYLIFIQEIIIVMHVETNMIHHYWISWIFWVQVMSLAEQGKTISHLTRIEESWTSAMWSIMHDMIFCLITRANPCNIILIHVLNSQCSADVAFAFNGVCSMLSRWSFVSKKNSS